MSLRGHNLAKRFVKCLARLIRDDLARLLDKAFRLLFVVLLAFWFSHEHSLAG